MSNNTIIKQYNYDNGLRVVYQKNNLHISAISIMVGVGSNYENYNSTNGMSHYLEHMLFKGTKKYKNSKEISMIFDSYGCYINAYTDKENTSYVIKCDTQYLEKCFKVLGDIVLNTIFKKSEFEKEKHVVIEELKRVNDNTAVYIIDECYKLLYSDNTLGLSTGGDENQILNFKIKKLNEFYKQFYNPNNIVISVCSDLDFKEIIKMIDKIDLANKKNNYDCIPKLISNNIVNNNDNYKLNLIDRDLEQTHISIGFKTCDIKSEDKYVLDIINAILTGSMSSLLFLNLREKYGLTYNTSIEQSEYIQGGVFIIYTSVDKSRVVKSDKGPGAITIIINTLNCIKEKGISLAELKKIKGFLKGSLTLEYEDCLNLSDYNGRQIISNQQIISLEKLSDIYDKITLKQINTIIDKYFKKELMSVVLIGKGIKKNKALVKEELDRLK
jgi:predicted Zn-dependent peptidase